ncbi:MAG: hypothetical protein LAT67_12595 [Balneolales bacterium]|nr:hypothetical protein [Balneolales bacterium]
MDFKFLKVFLVLLLSFFWLAACGGPTQSGSDAPVTSMDDLRVPDSFDWKTQRDITLVLNGYKTSLVRLVDDKGIEYHRANLFDNQPYTFKLTVPAYMNEITVLYRGQQKKITLDRSQISLSFQSANS